LSIFAHQPAAPVCSKIECHHFAECYQYGQKLAMMAAAEQSFERNAVAIASSDDSF